MTAQTTRGKRPPFDREIVAIADYVANKKITSALAYETARYCLMDTIGWAALLPLMVTTLPGA
mgnify:CR=1 FL=1